MSVASFYRQFMGELGAAGIHVAINVMPNEVPDPIPFPEDEVHCCAYDTSAASAFRQVHVQVDRIFRLFRTAFLGKASPVHYFLGQL
jgi:hypothetical protein